MVYDRLISLNVLLESLIGTDQELTHRISHRCATILGKNSHERGEIYEKIRKYYGQRSTILQGSKKIIANRDLYYLAEIIRTMIILFVSLVQNEYSQKRDELMKQLDKAVVDEELRSKIINQARKSFLEKADPQFENNPR